MPNSPSSKSTAKAKGSVEARKGVQEKLEINISAAQREYVRGIRQWLAESSDDKTVMVGGPVK